ncbi:MAG: hypothetical protein EOS23_26470 [Mesorhizobium sp.]|nr:MAG: hypothetical protein EOS23_26470 [Mesorhizobium sp.]
MPGELFRFSLNSAAGSSLAILLQMSSDGDPLFGMLSSPEFNNPLTWYGGDSNDHCLSYGTEWLLDERPGPETAPGNSYQQNANVKLFVDRQATVIKFTPPSGFTHQAINFDLVAGKVGHQISNRAAPIARWAIWASLDQYNSPRAKELFEYPPKADA